MNMKTMPLMVWAGCLMVVLLGLISVCASYGDCCACPESTRCHEPDIATAAGYDYGGVWYVHLTKTDKSGDDETGPQGPGDWYRCTDGQYGTCYVEYDCGSMPCDEYYDIVAAGGNPWSSCGSGSTSEKWSCYLDD